MDELTETTFALSSSSGFPAWLKASGVSLAFTTYQAGKVLFLGLNPDDGLSVFERSFPRAMGLCASTDGRTLMLATQVQLFRFDNVLDPDGKQGIYDAVYAPHQTWITGDLDMHDIGIGPDNRPVFANTLFNCIGAAADGHSFRPLWLPSFISGIAAGDRCHLNGLAMEDTTPRYVTCISRSNSIDGWRNHRRDGGVVVDVASGDIVAEGLSMPHSPRLLDGRLWLLNSGTGEFGWIDTQSGQFNAIAFCPGYARGLAFCGRYAIVGLSRTRANRTFQDLVLDDALVRHNEVARTGLLVIDTQSGDTVAWVRIEGVINELFDIAVLRGVRCPTAIGIRTSEIRRVISIADR